MPNPTDIATTDPARGAQGWAAGPEPEAALLGWPEEMPLIALYSGEGDRARARAIFDHALALDDTFSESHGALAVLDILEGNIETARVRTETALRLDRRGFSAALAQSLLFQHDGNPEAAERIRELTLNTPVGDSGTTIAEAMINMAPNWRGVR